MKRYLLDTGIASDYVNRRRGVYERAREARARGDRIGTTTPVPGELWYGIECSETRTRNAARLKQQLAYLTKDSDLSAVPGLDVEDWSTEVS